MDKKLVINWAYAAGVRAIKTIAQTALGMLTIGAAVNEINWSYVLSVSVMAGIYSILTSIVTNLPEVGTDGSLLIDQSNPDLDKYRIVLTEDPETLAAKTVVRLMVESNAILSTSQE